MNREIIPTMFLLFASVGFLFTDGDCEGYASIKESCKINPICFWNYFKFIFS